MWSRSIRVIGRASRARLLQQADSEGQCRQLFTELVVHVAGDAATLVFLREHEPREQFRAGPFGFPRLPFGEVEMGTDDANDGAAWFAPNRKPP